MKQKLTPYLAFKKDFEKDAKAGKIQDTIKPETVRVVCPKLEKGIICLL